MTIAGLAAGIVLAALALLHVVWAFGPRPLPTGVIPTRADGSPVLAPGRGMTLAVAVLLLAAAFLVLEQSGAGPAVLPVPFARIGSAGVAVVLLLRVLGDFRYVGLFKRERTTTFARMDTRLFTPLALALAVLAGIVAAWGG